MQLLIYENICNLACKHGHHNPLKYKLSIRVGKNDHLIDSEHVMVGGMAHYKNGPSKVVTKEEF